MKKLLIATLAVTMMLAASINAEATLLTPGSSTVPVTTVSPGAGDPILASIIDAPVVGVDADDNVYFTGTYSTWVKQDTDGFLVFEYEFSIVSAIDGVSSVSMTNFLGFTTDVGADGTLADEYPILASRLVSGTTVRFEQAFGSEVGAGETSALMWIKTDATNYKNGSFVLQDGGNARVAAFAPASAVPEPTSMLLFGTGLLGFVGKLRKRFVA